MTEIWNDFYTGLQEECPPAIWSLGVQLNRSKLVVWDQYKDGDYFFKIAQADASVSAAVTLNPETGDWYCDLPLCEKRYKNHPCPHVVAALLFLKTQNYQVPRGKSIANSLAQINYRFSVNAANQLCLTRFLIQEGQSEFIISSTISSYQSGRLAAPKFLADRIDTNVDQLIFGLVASEINHKIWRKIFELLAEKTDLFFNEKKVFLVQNIPTYTGKVEKIDTTYKLTIERNPQIVSLFENGAALLLDGSLASIRLPDFNLFDKKYLLEASLFSQKEVAFLFGELLPKIEKSGIAISQNLQRQVSIEQVEVYLAAEVQKDSEHMQLVLRIYYGDPPLARWENDQLRTESPDNIPLRNPLAEKQLLQKIENLQFEINKIYKFSPPEAIAVLGKLKAAGVYLKGAAADYFWAGELSPYLEDRENGKTLELKFLLEAKHSLASVAAHSDVDKQRYDIAEIFQAWRSGKNYVPLFKGGFARIPEKWLESYSEIFSDLKSGENKLDLEKISSSKKLLLTDWYLKEGKLLPRSLVASANLLLNTPIEISDYEKPNLSVELRAYQLYGFAWLSRHREIGSGALLADDMGLGKTLQAISAIKGNTLIVAPRSLLFNWQSEIQRFRPELRVALYHGKNRQLFEDKNVVVTSYATLRLDLEKFVEKKWDLIILDEAQVIKNPQSLTSQSIFELAADSRFALTGTPIENNLEELWSLFRFLNPGLLGSLKEFQKNYLQDSGSDFSANSGTSAFEDLKKKIRPFILRRLKREVLSELPEKTELTLYIELSDQEKQIYDSLLQQDVSELKRRLAEGKGMIEALELILRLRQAACHPALLPGHKGFIGSSKVDALIARLLSMVANEQKGLVFSQWTGLLDLIGEELTQRGMNYLRLDGQTKNRAELVEQFQNKTDAKIFLISLKAGGLGLNLTAAEHVFIFDPWWNPAVEDQAGDRAHRLGQTQKVMVHRLVARGTIEEGILQLQESKRQLMSEILGDEEDSGQQTQSHLTAREIANLLQI
ncbi:MAG: DEAD/DEAH box helicase [Oligoflexales bacterium]|nr:DEAD/DEAH box helicase [Oligoflexales bacterium]